jgi:hypothetical protein
MGNSESSIVDILTRGSSFTSYKCTLSLIYETTFMHVYICLCIYSVNGSRSLQSDNVMWSKLQKYKIELVEYRHIIRISCKILKCYTKSCMCHILLHRLSVETCSGAD